MTKSSLVAKGSNTPSSKRGPQTPSGSGRKVQTTITSFFTPKNQGTPTSKSSQITSPTNLLNRSIQREQENELEQDGLDPVSICPPPKLNLNIEEEMPSNPLTASSKINRIHNPLHTSPLATKPSHFTLSNKATKIQQVPTTQDDLSAEGEDDEDLKDAWSPLKYSQSLRKAKNVKRRIESDGDSEGENNIKHKKRLHRKEDDNDYQHADFEDDNDSDSKSCKTPVRQKSKWNFGSAKKSLTPSSQSTSTLDSNADTRKKMFKEKNEASYNWLKDIKDAEERIPSDPQYDPSTLYIPSSAWSRFTHFEKQFWEIKRKHFDTVVFFKKGKFYELFERDADIGHQEFDLKMTDRTHMRMVGVPESSFEYWATQFIAKGYKVAQVDQMETAVGKTLRAKSENSREDKVIRRELKAVLTPGTLVESGMISNDLSTYIMSIKEVISEDSTQPKFGICIADCATAQFYLSSFKDDIVRTQFKTLLLQMRPREIIYEKNRLSTCTSKLIKQCASSAILNGLQSEKDFWDGETTLYELKTSNYFKNERKNSEDLPTLSDEDLPEGVRCFLSNSEVMSSLGAMISYLRKLKLDHDLVSLGNFTHYNPVRHGSSLVMDGQTLVNLEIFQNSCDGGENGTLYKLLNHCKSPFGKRLLRIWLCHPLRDVIQINHRLDAIDDLNAIPGIRDGLKIGLAKLPDLERLLSRIHAGTCRVKEFLSVLDGYEESFSLIKELQPFKDDFKSKQLKGLFETFPFQLSKKMDIIKASFNRTAAEEEGMMVPEENVEGDYDEIMSTINNIESQFEEYLAEQKKTLRCSKMVYKDIGKEIYQIEVPENFKVPKDWIRMSKTKAVNRYWSSKIRNLVKELNEAKEVRNNVLRQMQNKIYSLYDQDYSGWKRIISILSELDCLLSLATTSLAFGTPVCRPSLISPSGTFTNQSILELKTLRHPCIPAGVHQDFIPNDTIIGGNDPNLILLTGPNMGGKSTLLRQTCLAVILAQMGCYVPAEQCTLTPFDRIFTRIGANDNIMGGQSTFMVELSETSRILQEASVRSLVTLDELGRGTSTYDGYAIAFSVLQHLSSRIGCLGLFSTHYGMLAKEFEDDGNISLMHMKCLLDEEEKQVTFLYKLTPGVCPKSYGMNVASMAGIPRNIVDHAGKKAEEFEQSNHFHQMGERKKGLSGNSVAIENTLLPTFAKLVQLCKAKDPLMINMNHFNSLLKSLQGYNKLLTQ